jgi:hypothetical protein
MNQVKSLEKQIALTRLLRRTEHKKRPEEETEECQKKSLPELPTS